ncbi:MAG: hypothetical protein ING16_15345 [Roseomonas sp.]|nr:hypothetical protein [Roseomonas sp.]MCA3284237.1 hypothetical protein [Roseomonas sp.]MCA3300122.1 hypothetical protein [Roseomonas sp.]
MKTAAALLVVLAVAGCAGQSREDIFPPDTSADAAACREEARRDPALRDLRHSIFIGFQAQEERVRNEIIATQRRTYFDCMALRGHARQGGVERVRR